MFKIIQTLALVIMIVLFPPAALITVSQGAVQGDGTYPIKRWLEDQVLFLASFNPTTRALYAAAQANRRYEESAKLLSKGDNADSTLEELVTQSNIAAGDINQVNNSGERVKLITDLSASLSKYDQGLAQAQKQIYRSTEIRNTQSVPSPQPGIQASMSPSTPKPSVTQSTPQPSIKTTSPTPRPTDSPADEEARRQQEAIEKARRELEELRKKLEEEKKKLQEAAKQNANSVSSPTPTPKPSPKPSPSPSPKSSPSPSPSPVSTSIPSPSVNSGKKGKSELNSQSTSQHGSQEGEDD